MLHQAVRKAFAFAHPGRRLTLLQPDLEDFREIRYQSRDGLDSLARFAASRNQGTILLAHGLGSSGKNLALLARLLMREGYGILLMDLRAHGNSQGDTSTYGWKEGGDLACMVEIPALAGGCEWRKDRRLRLLARSAGRAARGFADGCDHAPSYWRTLALRT